ncbi:hypothetical protein HPB50_011713 [Hyalomma asiaticum]|uniref:Uncharacterized protein n=1 Tax=Hyalomma asiaticum TaxID=266040 RepID=A0ACB7SVC9_HYAAI|nr:hypothetical protein HPB50_011713 [Hyalomma asiaticum]
MERGDATVPVFTSTDDVLLRSGQRLDHATEVDIPVCVTTVENDLSEECDAVLSDRILVVETRLPITREEIKLQFLIAYLVVEAYGLDHHQQPIQAGYRGTGFGGYAAAGTPYSGYDAYVSPPQPYSFGYDNVDEYGNRQFRSEQGDANNAKTGSYGYRDVNGLYRRVNYVADANGFRATVDTNEPGTAPGSSADAVFNAAPVVPPVPSGAAPSGAAPAFAATASAPYSAAGYGGYGRYGYNPYAGAVGTYGYPPYARQGYPGSGAALGVQAYDSSAPYGRGALGYGAGYGPALYGAPAGYRSWPSAHHGFRRR